MYYFQGHLAAGDGRVGVSFWRASQYSDLLEDGCDNAQMKEPMCWLKEGQESHSRGLVVLYSPMSIRRIWGIYI